MKTADWKRLAKLASIMSKVEYKNDCWIYPSKTRGQVRRGGKVAYVHRCIYEIWHGIILPKNTVIRHLCHSNGKCVNPEHLMIGTQQQNMADKRFPPLVEMIKHLEDLGYTVSSSI